MAGKFGQPFLGAYAASKHALEGLSGSLRRELLLYGIDVIVIGPGSVRTPIWDKAEASDFSRYEGTDYGATVERVRSVMTEMGRAGLPAERIGEVVWKALTAQHPRTRYTVVPQPLRHWIMSVLPVRVVDRMIARRLFVKESGKHNRRR